jgi:hypothetical protein
MTRIINAFLGGGWTLVLDVGDGPANVHGVKAPLFSWALEGPKGSTPIAVPLEQVQAILAYYTAISVS